MVWTREFDQLNTGNENKEENKRKTICHSNMRRDRMLDALAELVGREFLINVNSIAAKPRLFTEWKIPVQRPRDGFLRVLGKSEAVLRDCVPGTLTTIDCALHHAFHSLQCVVFFFLFRGVVERPATRISTFFEFQRASTWLYSSSTSSVVKSD